jgi:hypothetical protein
MPCACPACDQQQHDLCAFTSTTSPLPLPNAHVATPDVRNDDDVRALHMQHGVMHERSIATCVWWWGILQVFGRGLTSRFVVVV